MEPSPNSSLQKKITKLRGTFISQLPIRLETAQQYLNRLQADPEDREAVVALHRIYHSIKGTGHSFRFNEVAKLAEQAEELCQQLLDKTPADELLTLCALHDELTQLSGTLQHSLLPNDAEQQLTTIEMEEGDKCRESTTKRQHLIYICDDEIDFVSHLSYQLSCFGFRVNYFIELDAFEKAVKEKVPDAVVMDLRFPQGSTAGTEVLARLQQSLGISLPSLALSGRDDFDARLSAARAGCRAYFTKSAKSLDLVSALDDMLKEDIVDPFRVLMIDDDQDIMNYHTLILETAGMLVHQLSQPEKIHEFLQNFRPDIVLMDMYMPKCSGPELTTVIRQYPEHLSLPIVYLSSETNRQKQFSAMRAGVEGFITKPVEPNELIEAVSLRAERMRALRSLMVRDSLTGLYNHTTTTDLIQNAISRARRQQENLSLTMIDLDNFKLVNDQHGHVMGDRVLVTLARLFRHRLRGNDIIGRYGGEEFAILLADTEPDAACILIDKLREDFSRIRFGTKEDPFHCTFSAGISGFPECTEAEDLRIVADNALYTAKHAGRNQIKIGKTS